MCDACAWRAADLRTGAAASATVCGVPYRAVSAPGTRYQPPARGVCSARLLTMAVPTNYGLSTYLLPMRMGVGGSRVPARAHAQRPEECAHHVGRAREDLSTRKVAASRK